MNKKFLTLAIVAFFAGSTMCMGQNHSPKSQQSSNKNVEQIISNLGLNEKQSKKFKAAMEDMEKVEKMEKNMKSGQTVSEKKAMCKKIEGKRSKSEAKIKKILTNEQYKKYQQYQNKQKPQTTQKNIENKKRN